MSFILVLLSMPISWNARLAEVEIKKFKDGPKKEGFTWRSEELCQVNPSSKSFNEES